ncbi:biosynthetic arginine decarboxylase [Pelagicoccus albus]|uniref:Arginine decarboxylase n=1 Tax=Pelagicoccus albus TaxID=415222 RepID=A0A7X1B8B2_9BACT|nr:biosynthetic arginine decarboxylase [Pelagicoccus albus]MBC2607544.1 biosynthetic arginine decarboxylase [Pelagicoccus albus]
MSPKSRWTTSEAERLYGFNRWGSPYFSVDKEGYVCAHPAADDISVRIDDVIKEAATKGIKAPMVIRFQDLLRHRVERLNKAFADSIRDEDYPGHYRGVFPIKVNQLREVVEEIQDAGENHCYGLEAGSKPELMIAMAMHQHSESLLICNGYKDEDYIRLALNYRKIGKDIIIVAEQLSELEMIISMSKELDVEPLIGLRSKLGTRGEGKWAMSTGDNAKFGLTSMEILEAARMLEKANLTESLCLLHFHIGSQVPNIITLKNAVVEATRYYCQLQKMGFPMGFLDVGGGLGIDYDGSRSNYESSTNYTLEEYARDVVYNVKQICGLMDVPCPNLVTESGRAIVAPHSILITEVTGRISKRDSLLTVRKDEIKHQVVADLHEILNGRNRYGNLEIYHDAQQKKEEADSLFSHGYLDLLGRAQAESLFWQICNRLEKNISKTKGYQPEELIGLSELLSDQYVCNFSVFQSLLDHWALDQLFPITPITRLNERPTVNAILVDITCDSDGKVSKFIDLEDEKQYLPLHPLKKGDSYFLGIFLVGAYQDIMGDNHNLFGRVNEVHVFLDEDEDDGFYIEDTIQGFRMKDVLEGVQYSAGGLCQNLKKQIDKATKADLVKPRDGVRFMELYEEQLQKKTYLDIEQKKKRRAAPRKAKAKPQ